MIDFGIYAAYVLIGLAVLSILAFAGTNIAKNPKGAKSALVGIIGLALIIGITYATSSGEDANTIYADKGITEGESHLVGMGLATFYTLGALTILSILYVEVTRLFKK